MPSTEAAEDLTHTDVDDLPWADDYASAEEPDTQFDEYDLTATPKAPCLPLRGSVGGNAAAIVPVGVNLTNSCCFYNHFLLHLK